ncbi:MAG: hypothetical protein NTW04_06250, partial [Elusimicrobia bacterium]|nr:hypothetical protein [Elusimicrobiota bacterium]
AGPQIIHYGVKSSENLGLRKFAYYKESEYLYFKKCLGPAPAAIVRASNMFRYLFVPNKDYFDRLKIIWRSSRKTWK